MKYFPIFTDLNNKSVLVIGQYRVLEFKIEKMIEAGARITYLCDVLPEKLKQYVKTGIVTFVNDKFREKYLENMWLVVCGSDDAELKKRIEKICEEKNIFCNFVDEAPISSFISPSVISMGDITIAISTKGKSPALNKFIKNEIKKTIGDEYSEFAEILGRMRPEVIKNIPGQKRRSELFDAIVQNTQVLGLIKNKKYTQAENLVRELIANEIRKINNFM